MGVFISGIRLLPFLIAIKQQHLKPFVRFKRGTVRLETEKEGERERERESRKRRKERGTYTREREMREKKLRVSPPGGSIVAGGIVHKERTVWEGTGTHMSCHRSRDERTSTAQTLP